MVEEPRNILICCEGQTEKAFFDLIINIRRINSAVVLPSQSFGSQHTQLIDICTKERTRVSLRNDISEDEVEVWAVFDKDQWRDGFTALEQYARSNSVQLAYSDPQFETYLLQHIQADGFRGSGAELEDYLSDILSTAGYGEYIKGDIKWLAELLDGRPRVLEAAIVNSNIRNRRNRTPFLTVHKLTERILQFEVR